MTETQTTLQQFIETHELGIDVEPADSNPNMASDDAWMREASHWLVVITQDGQSMRVPFSQGSAHTEPPTLETVLDCLASDASSVENSGSFDEWAADMGFFPMESSKDLRRAQQTYEAIEHQTNGLKALIGARAFDQLLYHTERL